MAQVQKLSVATVFGKIPTKQIVDEKRIHVMSVMGIAVGVKTGEASYGPWEALQGTFRATNPKTGEVNDAAILFLPDVAMMPIKLALSQAGARGVEFAINVYANLVDENKKKAGGSIYEYSWEPVIPIGGGEDPLAKLEAKIMAALPAPSEEGSKKKAK